MVLWPTLPICVNFTWTTTSLSKCQLGWQNISTYRLSTFITIISLQLELMTSVHLATTPKRLLILVWAFSATQSNTGRSNHPPSGVSMCALPFRSETTSNLHKGDFSYVELKSYTWHFSEERKGNLDTGNYNSNVEDFPTCVIINKVKYAVSIISYN